MSWLDMTPGLTVKGQHRLQVGQVMVFDYEGSQTYIRIMRKHKGKVWGKEITLYHPGQVRIVDK